MFHGGLYEGNGKYSEEKVDNERLKRFWKRHSQIPSEWVNMEADTTFYLTPDEALTFGVVDRIKSK